MSIYWKVPKCSKIQSFSAALWTWNACQPSWRLVLLGHPVLCRKQRMVLPQWVAWSRNWSRSIPGWWLNWVRWFRWAVLPEQIITSTTWKCTLQMLNTNYSWRHWYDCRTLANVTGSLKIIWLRQARVRRGNTKRSREREREKFKKQNNERPWSAETDPHRTLIAGCIPS